MEHVFRKCNVQIIYFSFLGGRFDLQNVVITFLLICMRFSECCIFCAPTFLEYIKHALSVSLVTFLFNAL